MERLIMFHLVFIFEWLALIIFTLTIFRHPIRQYWHMVAVGSLFMTIFSYIVRDVLGLVKPSPAIQLIVLVILFMLLFRIRFLFAAIMVSFGYLGYVTYQNSLVSLMKALSYFPSENILESYSRLYVLSAISTITILTICALLNKYRIGFTYELDRDTRLTLRQKLIFIGFLLCSTVLNAAILYLFELYSIELFVFISIGILYVMFGFLLKKEIKLASRYSGKME